MGGSPFIISIWEMIGFGSRRPYRIGFWSKSASEKVVNCYGASSRRFVKNISSQKPSRIH